MRRDHKGHVEIAKHSPMQQRMFFGISTALGYNQNEVKERAKNYFKVNCFNALKTSDLALLIDRLVQQQFKNEK